MEEKLWVGRRAGAWVGGGERWGRESSHPWWPKRPSCDWLSAASLPTGGAILRKPPWRFYPAGGAVLRWLWSWYERFWFWFWCHPQARWAPSCWAPSEPVTPWPSSASRTSAEVSVAAPWWQWSSYQMSLFRLSWLCMNSATYQPLRCITCLMTRSWRTSWCVEWLETVKWNNSPTQLKKIYFIVNESICSMSLFFVFVFF